MTQCRSCQEQIYFDENHLSKNGKKIPMETFTDAPHNCPNSPTRYLPCHKCHEDIFFSEEFISKTGKKIPLSRSTRLPHECSL